MTAAYRLGVTRSARFLDPLRSTGCVATPAANPLEMNNVTDAQRTRSSLMSATAPHARKLLAASVVIALSGCSAMNSIISGDKVDYHGTASEKTPGLEVPPDLTQLARDSRYQQQAASGSFSAATFQSGSQPAGRTVVRMTSAKQRNQNCRGQWRAHIRQ